MRRGTVLILIVLAVAVIGGFSCVSSYNNLVSLNEKVQASWSQVENVYQRRADLIPNLVATVKGAADFEKSTIIAVTEARAKVGSVQATPDLVNDPQAFQKFQQAQDELSGALSRLLVVAENYPDLKSTANFRDLQVQLEGTENRITVERQRYNEVAQEYNSKRNRFPTVLIAGLFGGKFAEKPYFQASAGAQKAPEVKF